jgi:predicted DNA-binding protein YlxM (UPF0122 family)
MIKTPKAIYLDSTVFFEAKFNFKNGILIELGGLAFSHGIEIWCSDIAITEVLVEVKKRLNAIEQSIKRAENILEYSGKQLKINNKWLQKTFENVHQAMTDYFHNEEIIQLSVEDLDDSDITEIFQDYAKGRGCFASERKRNEFPDAFQLSMVMNKLKTNETLCIVSNDRDISHACKNVPQIEVVKSIFTAVKELRAKEIT